MWLVLLQITGSSLASVTGSVKDILPESCYATTSYKASCQILSQEIKLQLKIISPKRASVVMETNKHGISLASKVLSETTCCAYFQNMLNFTLLCSTHLHLDAWVILVFSLLLFFSSDAWFNWFLYTFSLFASLLSPPAFLSPSLPLSQPSSLLIPYLTVLKNPSFKWHY